MRAASERLVLKSEGEDARLVQGRDTDFGKKGFRFSRMIYKNIFTLGLSVLLHTGDV